MNLIIGRGYVGAAMAEEFSFSKTPFAVANRSCVELASSFGEMVDYFRSTGATCVVNCGAFIAGGRADNCEDYKADNFLGNLVFPSMVANACELLGIRLLHVSTACLFIGHNFGFGYSETDTPHLSFRARNDCGVYVGAKQLAEEVVARYNKSWICRIRLPFDQYDNPRNYITKIRSYPKVVDAFNSLSHRGDFCRICREMIERNVEFGTYNVVNEGAIWTHEIVDRLGIKVDWWDNQEFEKTVARTPKSTCTLSVAKLKRAGIAVRSVDEAINDSIQNWTCTEP